NFFVLEFYHKFLVQFSPLEQHKILFHPYAEKNAQG
ncbi:MAG: hypothetical protein ACI9DJ_002312, partial [Algoriphagus sp.]